MSSGFIIGKFHPLHRGHLAMIDFASQRCDLLYVILCVSPTEKIEGVVRKRWLEQEMAEHSNINVLLFPYNETELPNTSVSSREVSAKWAKALKSIVPDVSFVFSSEPYGDYLAEYMNIRHIPFDLKKERIPVSASTILKEPFRHWDYIANAAKPWFVKKIVLLGSESTGKSTLAEKLALHFRTAFVAEAAREIIEKTDEVQPEDLEKIAALHAKRINEKIAIADKLLFLDTDITITKSYSRFLFGQELVVEPWIEEANKADIYLFLETDAPFVQDGTRLDKIQRERLSQSHKEELLRQHIPYITITGNWEERFILATRIVKDKFSI